MLVDTHMALCSGKWELFVFCSFIGVSISCRILVRYLWLFGFKDFCLLLNHFDLFSVIEPCRKITSKHIFAIKVHILILSHWYFAFKWSHVLQHLLSEDCKALKQRLIPITYCGYKLNCKVFGAGFLCVCIAPKTIWPWSRLGHLDTNKTFYNNKYFYKLNHKVLSRDMRIPIPMPCLHYSFHCCY